jgi:SAM-dependent methyltransferase
LDISRKTVNQLRELFPDNDFQAGDIRDTGMEDNTFDACFSWGVFEHFEDGPGDCLREAFRILKPGGLLFASVPFDNWRMSTKGTFAKPADANSKERFYQYRFTRAEWAREMTKAGFTVEALEPIHKRQGVLRCLHHEFLFPYEWLFTRGLSTALAPFLPGAWIAHMLLGVARKPGVCEK